MSTDDRIQGLLRVLQALADSDEHGYSGHWVSEARAAIAAYSALVAQGKQRAVIGHDDTPTVQPCPHCDKPIAVGADGRAVKLSFGGEAPLAHAERGEGWKLVLAKCRNMLRSVANDPFLEIGGTLQKDADELADEADTALASAPAAAREVDPEAERARFEAWAAGPHGFNPGIYWHDGKFIDSALESLWQCWLAARRQGGAE